MTKGGDRQKEVTDRQKEVTDRTITYEP